MAKQLQTIRQYHSIDKKHLSQQLLSYSRRFEVLSILDSNRWEFDIYGEYDLLAAFGAREILNCGNKEEKCFEQLRNFHQKHQNWLFGFLSYDLKNQLEKLDSKNTDGIQAPRLFFFIPEILLLLKNDTLSILASKASSEDLNYLFDLLESKESAPEPKQPIRVTIRQRMDKESYIQTVEKIRRHIKLGDVYELNYCQEFYAEQAALQADVVFRRLIEKSPTPFSAFLRAKEIYVMSASPERYIRKKDALIVSQPIKGTARRVADKQQDAQIREQLQEDIKERAENIMIVDLVRNDLAHTAQKNSVKVEELCGIYSFRQVHQMISTVSSRLHSSYDFVDVLKTTFPMGSMTGAPKIRAMELIEQYEKTRRGIYSGAIGYITPEGDFDFNVVIRSLIYNADKKYLSFIAGGAITWQSVPEKEYEESLLKVEAIREILDYS